MNNQYKSIFNFPIIYTNFMQKPWVLNIIIRYNNTGIPINCIKLIGKIVYIDYIDYLCVPTQM